MVIVSPVRAHPIDDGEVQDGDGAFFVAFGARPREGFTPGTNTQMDQLDEW